MSEILLKTKYVIVTPVRDEKTYLPITIEHVAKQSVLPSEWVIVDDGSSDGTGEIIDRYAQEYPWIRAIHRANRGFRKSGAGVVEAFQQGVASLETGDWEYIVKLDGDLSFDENYFRRLFQCFAADARLGIAGGTLYHIVDGVKQVEHNPRFHVRGATKVYRRQCWEAIGGLRAAPGWDTVDEVHANMLGWRTESVPDIHLLHHRYTGTAERPWKDMFKGGRACYFSGYHPVFMLARCLSRMTERPYGIGALAMLSGFVSGYVKGLPTVNDSKLIEYLRQQQVARLLGRATIWR